MLRITIAITIALCSCRLGRVFYPEVVQCGETAVPAFLSTAIEAIFRRGKGPLSEQDRADLLTLTRENTADAVICGAHGFADALRGGSPPPGVSASAMEPDPALSRCEEFLAATKTRIE